MLSSIRRATCVTFTCASIAACGEGSDSPHSVRAQPVLTGEVRAVPEAEGYWVWGGDGGEEFCQQWSLSGSQSGWFYGSTYVETSNADVYVLEGTADPLSVADASAFPYASDSELAEVGDTVFFRTARGIYGAWSIESIDEKDQLSGTWYVQADGSGDFTRGTTDTGRSIENRARCPHPVLSGPIQGIPESNGVWAWGEDDQLFCQQWSLQDADSGWFYGMNGAPFSCVNVHVVSGLRDPLSVADARAFPYSLSPRPAQAGDTVFFTNAHGFIGAWTVEHIDEEHRLFGTWYLQSDRSGDFTTGVIDTGLPLRNIRPD
jgi:hypothetical protein